MEMTRATWMLILAFSAFSLSGLAIGIAIPMAIIRTHQKCYGSAECWRDLGMALCGWLASVGCFFMTFAVYWRFA